MQAIYGKNKSDPLLDKALEAVEGYSNSLLYKLEGVLKDELNVEKINWNLNPLGYGDDSFGYIDHQSAGWNGDMSIYEDIGSLRRFLFAEDSFITEENDNH